MVIYSHHNTKQIAIDFCDSGGTSALPHDDEDICEGGKIMEDHLPCSNRKGYKWNYDTEAHVWASQGARYCFKKIVLGCWYWLALPVSNRGSSWARVGAVGQYAVPTSPASSNGSVREAPGPVSSATTNIRSLPSAPRIHYRWAADAGNVLKWEQSVTVWETVTIQGFDQFVAGCWSIVPTVWWKAQAADYCRVCFGMSTYMTWVVGLYAAKGGRSPQALLLWDSFGCILGSHIKMHAGQNK